MLPRDGLRVWFTTDYLFMCILHISHYWISSYVYIHWSDLPIMSVHREYDIQTTQPLHIINANFCYGFGEKCQLLEWKPSDVVLAPKLAYLDFWSLECLAGTLGHAPYCCQSCRVGCRRAILLSKLPSLNSILLEAYLDATSFVTSVLWTKLWLDRTYHTRPYFNFSGRRVQRSTDWEKGFDSEI